MSIYYSKNQVYERNGGILHQYGENSFKLVQFRSLRQPGFVDASAASREQTCSGCGNATKLRESLSRSKHKVLELAKCNPWEFFITLTLAGQNGDRYDLAQFQKRLSKWLNNFNFQHQQNIKYLIIPEPHQDGAWHFHGLLSGLSPSYLRPFTTKDKIPSSLKERLQEGRLIFNWPEYQRVFGWVTAESIIDHDRIAAYLTKYITKDILLTEQGLNRHLYFCSQGLKRSVEVYRGPVIREFVADYENDYVRCKWFDNIDEALQIFTDEEVE